MALISIALGTFSCKEDKPEVEKVYTVTFDADGGNPVPAAQEVKEGEKATAPTSNPSKQGYVFLFWRLKGVETAYNFQTAVNANITLQAKWETETKVEYWQVTWNLNGGAWPANDNHATQVEKGGTIDEPNEPMKTGNTFEGWYKEKELTNKVSFPYDVNAVTADFTLYAKWENEPVEYWQVTWELDGGEWPEDDNHVTQVEKGGTIDEPNEPVKTGNTFEGWYKEKELTNKVSFPYDVNALTADFTLYAKWEDEPVTPVEAMVASGEFYYFVLKEDGTLYVTGRNNYGQLGTGDKTDVENLVQVANGVAAVYTGGFTFTTSTIRTFIVKIDGSVLGLETSGERTNFTTMPIDNVKAISTCNYHTIFLKNDGSIWSSRGTGEIMATELTSDVVSVSAGNYFDFALKKDGTVWGVGYDDFGALGQNAINMYYPSFIQVFSGAKAIATSYYHSLIITNEGTVYAAGRNHYGQLGVAATEDNKTIFTQAVDASGNPLTGVISVAANFGHSLALKDDGSLWATGANNYGQLGTGDRTDRNSFTQVATGVKAMSAGYYHTLILKNDGSIVVYGKVNPYYALNGSGSITVKVNDNKYGQYITQVMLYDSNLFQLTYYWVQITSAHPGHTISVKPDVYILELRASNLTAPHRINNLVVADNETVTVTYEYVSGSVPYAIYQWTVTRSK